MVKYNFKSWFNIIRYKYVKEIYFYVIFLTEKFVLSMIIRILAAREPAKPLNDAQMCGSFLFLLVFQRDIYQSVPTFMDAGRDIAIWCNLYSCYHACQNVTSLD